MKKKISVSLKGHEFSLRKLEVYERMSDETTAFCADVYIDNEYAGQASNDGHGGPNELYVSNAKHRDILKDMGEELCTHIATYEWNGNHTEWNYDWDFLISEMVADAYYDNKSKFTF